MSRVVSDLIRSRMQAARDEGEDILRAALKRPSRELEQQLGEAIRDRDTAKQELEAITAEVKRHGVKVEP